MGDDTRVNSGPYLWLLGCQGHSARSGKAAVLSRPPLSSRAPAQMTWGSRRQRPFLAVHMQRSGHGSPACHIFLLKMIKWWATHLGYGEHRKHPLPVPWPSQRTLTLFAPAGFGEGVCSALGPTFSSEGRAPAGGHVLPQSSSVTAWCEIRFLSAIDLTQRRWSRAVQNEVWQAREAGNPEENESVKQRFLPALVASSAWREGGGFWLSASGTSQSSGVW